MADGEPRADEAGSTEGPTGSGESVEPAIARAAQHLQKRRRGKRKLSRQEVWAHRWRKSYGDGARLRRALIIAVGICATIWLAFFFIES